MNGTPGGGPEGVPSQPPDDTRSYAERYRGTEWGAPEPVTLATVAGRRGRGGRRTMLLLGVLLLVGSVVAGVGLVVSGNVGGEAGRSPAATDTHAAVPTATTDPLVASAVINDFVRIAADPKLSFGVRMDLSVTSGKTVVRMTAVGKVAGPDADLQVAVTQSTPGSESFSGRMIVKGRDTWIQLDGQREWFKSGASDGVPDTDFFAALGGREDLVYAGRVMRRGSLTHHLVTPEGWQPGTVAQVQEQYPDMRVDTAAMDVWVLDDGRPLEVHQLIRLKAGGLGQTGIGAQSAEAEVTYILSNVGGKITIKAPK